MQYAIELYYDEETEKKLFALAQKVADEKLSTKFLEWKTRPHLTLACFNDVDEAKCTEILKEFHGDTEIVFYDANTKKYSKLNDLSIFVNEEILYILKSILGEDNVILKP